MTLYTKYDWRNAERCVSSWLEANRALLATLPEPLASIISHLEKRVREGTEYRVEHSWEGGGDASRERYVEDAAGDLYYLLRDHGGSAGVRLHDTAEVLGAIQKFRAAHGVPISRRFTLELTVDPDVKLDYTSLHLLEQNENVDISIMNRGPND